MLGLYIHIPYCLQRCSYCDFATYVYDQIMPPELYVELLQQELAQKASLFPSRELTSIYFGGGTPSLLSSDLILTILGAVAKNNLHFSKQTEVTLEINPATLDTQKIRALIRGGVNRFSVGAQTFDDALLKAAGRKHTSRETLQTLELLQSENVNYSFDLLFALPRQTLDGLRNDLARIQELQPPHLSAYCLTVPSGHPMSFHRPNDDFQTQMFEEIISNLDHMGLHRYEISNFAKPGLESRHNLSYWKDQPYVGLGLSAHSYLKHTSTWGQRFWNPSSIDGYKKLVEAGQAGEAVLSSESLSETLSQSDSLFDFCHTSLRLDEGLSRRQLTEKFPSAPLEKLDTQLHSLTRKNWLSDDGERWRLTPEGVLLSNQVFAEITIAD